MAEPQTPEPAMQSADPDVTEKKVHSMLDSNFPVFIPYARELTVSDQEFATYISTLKPSKTYVAPAPLTSDLKELEMAQDEQPTSRFIDALNQTHYANKDPATLFAENKRLTENDDVAFASTKQPLVDAFYELKSTANNIEHLLGEAWAVDPDATLKIIFNARSIHLGKADKVAAYKALGWLYQYHPQTLLVNLIWLARPVIEKKIKKDGATESKAEKEEVDDFEMIDEPGEDASSQSRLGTATLVLTAADAPLASNTTKNDVKYGVAHGYWKDLANMLLLAVNDQLAAHGNVRSILNVDNRKSVKPRSREWDEEKSREARRQRQTERHSHFEGKFRNEGAKQASVDKPTEVDESFSHVASESDGTFKALHLTIARLFTSQLRTDAAALASGKSKAISLAAKWCPSPSESHDKQTFIVTSIAEALFPFEQVCPEGVDPADRLTYLKHARQALRSKVLSPLRKHLTIVERDITAGAYTSIKYDRVPSLAMARYSGLFLSKDEERFAGYLEKVSTGKARVSGAVLLPSTLVSKARDGGGDYGYARFDLNKKKTPSQIQKLAEQRLLDGQWKTIVKRIKDSGKLDSAIAVCDVSGSMSGPRFSDGTCPMDSAIGLSLLLAEVVEPPFGGNFITFSELPHVQKVGGIKDARSFEKKVSYILNSGWGMSTNFVAVFEDLLLPIAVEHKLKQEEMVKKVFVFSDMQFDSAQKHSERWTSSYERIKERYAAAGYEMPELIFWNLAAGTRAAPVVADQEGVSLLSGYSQGLLKVFMDGGKFKDEVEEEVVDEDVAGDDGSEDGEGAIAVRVKKKVKKDPLATVKKAISHPAYAMLKVVD
jgi:hypothetical protein